jgi:uncharacterized protein YhaN
MRLTKIRLVDFKRHAQLEIEPADGLTIIRGPNEAGKSTIQTAIRLGLFRKADSGARDIAGIQRWGAAAAPFVELEFEADGERGRLSKRFAGQKADAQLSHGGESTTDFSLISERVAGYTGIPTEAFWRATASVGHAELGAVAGDEPDIQDRLQEAVSGVDRGTAAAKKKLETAIHRHKTAGHKNPGLLKVARERIEGLQADLSAGEAALGKLESDRASWVEAHERRKGLDVQLTRQQADLDEALRAETLASQRDATQDLYQKLRRASELVAQANQLRRATPTEIPLASLRTGVARATSLSLDLSELDAEISVGGTEPGGEGSPKPPRPWRWFALAIGLSVGAFVAWLLLGGLLGAIALTVLLVLAGITLVQVFRVAMRARQYGLAQEMAQAATSQREEVDRERQETFRRKRREFESQLEALGVPDVEKAQALLTTTEQHTEAMARIDGELRGLGVEERNLPVLEDQRDQAANEAEQAKHALAAMGAVAEDPVQTRVAAQRLVERTTPARNEARSAEDQAQGRVDANTVDAELVASLSERLIAERERLTELERRMAVYQATLAAIEDAERATLKTAARYLEERMGPAIGRITDGRYDEIEVDERNLAFRVRVPETGDFVDTAALSQGTADQLYLSARLGLVRLVTMDRRPPLILDDPFVTFDAERGERALRLVKEVAASQGFQVIYLTCSDRFDAVADELVVLEAPSADKAPKAVSSLAPEMPIPPREIATGPTAQPIEQPTQTTVFEAIADPETGVVDPFRLADSGGGEAGD